MLAGTKFDGVCSGVGLSAAVPYGASDQPIAKNTPVILDFALNYRGYHVDQTRMFSWGEPVAAVYEAYQAMARIEKALCLSLIPGSHGVQSMTKHWSLSLQPVMNRSLWV